MLTHVGSCDRYVTKIRFIFKVPKANAKRLERRLKISDRTTGGNAMWMAVIGVFSTELTDQEEGRQLRVQRCRSKSIQTCIKTLVLYQDDRKPPADPHPCRNTHRSMSGLHAAKAAPSLAQ